jgi:hypothetical protein
LLYGGGWGVMVGGWGWGLLGLVGAVEGVFVK